MAEFIISRPPKYLLKYFQNFKTNFVYGEQTLQSLVTKIEDEHANDESNELSCHLMFLMEE